jgi:hypothetical protein
MARWQGLGLVMLLAGCSLDTGPNSLSLSPSTSTPIWSPTRRPSTHEPQQTSGARDAGTDAATSDKPEKKADAGSPANGNHSPNAAGAPSTPPQTTPPPATNANDPDANVGGKPAADAGSAKPADASKNGPAADGGKPAGKPSSADPNKSGAQNGSGSTPDASTPGKQDDEKDDHDKDRGSRGHDDKDDRDRDDDSRDQPDDDNSVTQAQDGALTLLFTSVSNLVFSILDFSFGPAKPQNISNLVVSIVTLATLPASEVTTATLSDLLEQLDASNVCHDDRSACEALCETLIASCDLYKHDPRSVKNVERNCGAKSLAACK